MAGPVPQCGPHEHCITCGDAAGEMRVLRVDRARGLALCEHEDGSRRTVEVGLIDPVAAGDVVLVHADVALASAGEQAE